MGPSPALIFGALLAGAVTINYGARNVRAAFTGGSSSSSPARSGTRKGSYVAPIAHGAVHGRTDMGVDVSAPPGTPVRALGRSKVIGILQNWYSGQPYVWLKLLDGPDAGRYYYYAEQITPTVHPGDLLAAGDQVGVVARHGTAMEWGWAVSSGETLAQATGNTGGPGHSNSPAGRDFDRLLQAVGL